MNFQITKSDLEKIYHLFEVKETNIALANMLLYYFQIKSPMKEAKDHNDYLNKLIDACEIDRNNQDDIKIINQQIKPAIRSFDEKIITDDVYVSTLKFPTINIHDREFNKESYAPYQGFSYDEISVADDDFREMQKVGYFTSKITYPVLSYKNELWMSVTPNEIMTFEEPLKKAKGNIITFGLGMGYFVYLTSLKKEVTSVTVVEKDPFIIQLFNQYLLPQFKEKQKIIIIEQDACEFLKEKHQFDYAYVDLWHNPNDGLPFYLLFKKAEINFPHCRFDYWLETSILALYRRCLLTVALEQLNNLPESEYQKAKNETDKIINDIYLKTKNITIRSYEQFHRLCTDEGLKKLIVQ
ncbi:MAG: hypothetical protein WC201_04065 [Bacilli bacterium]